MKRFQIFAMLVVSIITFSVFANEAEAKCLLYRGSGGEAVFPGWTKSKVIRLEIRKSATLWLTDDCSKPKVNVAKGTHTHLKYDVEREDLKDPHNVAEGWRVYFWTTDPSDDGKSVVVKIRSGNKTWKVTVAIRANALDVARRASSDASDAKDTADEANKNSGGASGKRDVELTLGPLFSLESPGNEGYGLALGVNAILGKFASKGMVQLGISGRLSWHYYEQEVIGLAQNSDVMASEFDALAMFLFRLRPVSWFAAEASTGFGMRVFTHDDAVTIQDQSLFIRGVEGRVAAHPLWALNLGVKFWPSKVVSLGVQWGTTVSLTRQVQNPNAEGGDPSKGHLWNHFFLVTLGININ